MRNNFFKSFIKRFKKDPSLFFLTGDTGYNLVEEMFESNPERALNIGVAEQNMIGIASGLCNIGYTPVCYAITNFLVERCFEQIRNDICLHNYKVILIGTSTGYDNGALGPTHHKLDDIAAIKSLPNIDIYSPSGLNSLEYISERIFKSKRASYVRISKTGITEDFDVKSSNHFIYETDDPMLVISHGKMVGNAMEAYRISKDFSIFAMDRIKPLDDRLLHQLFKRFNRIFVVEDNFRSGLYNSICQWSVDNKSDHFNIVSIAPEESYSSVVGDTDYLEDLHGISPEKIAKSISEYTSS